MNPITKRLHESVVKSGIIPKRIMRKGQGSNNTTEMRRSIKNSAIGSRKMSTAL